MKIDDISELTAHIGGLDASALVTIEGFCKSGKTCLAKHLSHRLGIRSVDSDDFVAKQSGNSPYVQLLDLARLKENLEQRPVLLSGICLRDILSEIGLRSSVSIYVMRMSASDVWHDGMDMEAIYTGTEPMPHEPHASAYLYHVAHRPHLDSDVTYQWVEGNA